jgi:hypothetical protein
MTQAKIDAEAAIPSKFNMTVSGTWDGTHDNINATVNVTCVTAYTGSTVKLRVALVEDVYWPIAPGNNTEKMFENVVRAMYPDASGTAMTSSWAVSATNTYNLTCAVPSYVDKHGKNLRLVAWIQDDGSVPAVGTLTGNIQQAAMSPVLDATLANDVASDSLTVPAITCSSLTPTVVLTNTGSSTMTAATIYYQLDGGSWSTQAWSGSLASNASDNVVLTGISASGAGGFHTVKDSIVLAGDNNFGNNVSYNSFFYDKPGYSNTDVATDFEGSSLKTGYYGPTLADGLGWSWVNVTTSSAPGVSHSGQKAEYFSNPAAGSNHDVAYLYVPCPTYSGTMSLNWWTAYAQQRTTDNDQLEVVSSTDCGATWTSIWSKSGTDLATAPASLIGSGSGCPGCFLPTASQWRHDAVNIGSLAAGTILAFRNTSDDGNFIFIDDISITPFPAGVNNVVAAINTLNIAPNPAKDMAVLTMTLSETSHVQVDVVDAMGRTVVVAAANQDFGVGEQHVTINTASLPAGVYNVKIVTGTSVNTERLTVVK